MISLVVTALVLVVALTAWALLSGSTSKVLTVYDSNVESEPEPEPQKPRPLTDAEIEALRQAREAFDWKTESAILDRMYLEPLPELDAAGYWTNLYPDIYHTKIAGINYCRGIRDLAGVYFDALLIPEPKNKYDPNAIKIVHKESGRKLGYIPADETDDVRQFVNNNFPFQCRAHVDEYEDWDDERERDRTYLKGCVNIHKPT